jgi:hypothetical protein
MTNIIIVNGQLIGAIGVGGIPPAERIATYGEEICARARSRDRATAAVAAGAGYAAQQQSGRARAPAGPRTRRADIAPAYPVVSGAGRARFRSTTSGRLFGAGASR